MVTSGSHEEVVYKGAWGPYSVVYAPQSLPRGLEGERVVEAGTVCR